jgi:hypothetical protein
LAEADLAAQWVEAVEVVLCTDHHILLLLVLLILLL